MPSAPFNSSLACEKVEKRGTRQMRYLELDYLDLFMLTKPISDPAILRSAARYDSTTRLPTKTLLGRATPPRSGRSWRVTTGVASSDPWAPPTSIPPPWSCSCRWPRWRPFTCSTSLLETCAGRFGLRFGLYEGVGFELLSAAKAQGIAVAARPAPRRGLEAVGVGSQEKLGYLTASEECMGILGQ